MKKLFVILALATLSSMSCASGASEQNAQTSDNFYGDTVTKNFNFDEINGISVTAMADVHYVQGNKQSVKVVCKPEILSLLDIKEENGILTISFKGKSHKNNNWKENNPQIYLTTKDLNSITCSGVMSLSAKHISTPHISIKVKGVTSLNIDAMDCKQFEMDNSGVTKFMTSIKADSLDFASSGVTKGTMNFSGDILKISNRGVSTITFNVDCKHLDANNSGVGELKIAGTADDTKINTNGVAKMDVSNLNKY